MTLSYRYLRSTFHSRVHSNEDNNKEMCFLRETFVPTEQNTDGIGEMKYRPVISVRVILFLRVPGEGEGAPVDGNNTSIRVLRFPL